MASFESLLGEVNHKINSDYGRITLHLFYELNLDFLPHYCYNMATNRYVTTALALVEKPERGKGTKTAKGKLWGNELLAKCFSQIYHRYTTFVGESHFNAIVKFLDYQDVALVINELLKVIKSILTDSIKPYTVMLTGKGVFPEKCMLPRYDYKSTGTLTYFKAQFGNIIQYAHLKTSVFQSFREVGNAVLFCLHLEHALSRKEIQELKHAALFQSIIPKPHIPITKEQSKDKEARKQREMELHKKMEQLKEKYQSCHIVPLLGKRGTIEQKVYAQGSSLLAREKLCIGLSMFEMVLTKLKTFLDQDKDVWEKAMPPSEDTPIQVDTSRDFHRLWSAMQFIFCIPTGANQLSVEELFGDSLNWGGLTLIALLGQYRRFQVTDFCYHLYKLHQVDNLGDSKTGDPTSNVRAMASRIRRVQTLNDQIFSTLNKYLHQPMDGFSHLFNANIHHFEPPKPKLSDIPEPEMTSSPEVEVRRTGTLRDAVRDSVDLIEDDFLGEDDHTHA